MKIHSINNNTITPQLNYQNVNSQSNANSFQNISFKGAPPKPSPILDKILKNKLVKGLFELADKNPFAFNIVALATACMALRPATVMVVPGSNDKDKKYAAGKSIIASFVGTVSRLIFILPLGIAIKKLGEDAKKNTKINFPKEGTPEFKAFNFALNNGAGALIAIPTAALVVFLVAKIMDKLTHEPKNGNNSENTNNRPFPPAFSKIKNAQEDKNS